MVSQDFKQRAVVNYSGNQKSGKTNIFISHNWNKETLLANNYWGIKAGDVLYARSTDKRLAFDNLKLKITFPPSPKTGIGGLHCYTNDLVLPKAFKNLQYIELSNKPFKSTVDSKVIYTLPSGSKVTTSPTNPPEWVVVSTTQTTTNSSPKTTTETPQKTTTERTINTVASKTSGTVAEAGFLSGLSDTAKYFLLVVGVFVALKTFKII